MFRITITFYYLLLICVQIVVYITFSRNYPLAHSHSYLYILWTPKSPQVAVFL